MLVPVLLFAVGLLCLIKGGDWFVDGATGLARRFRLPELLIGATVVSIGTTLPEVMVSTTSALIGHGEIAYGNAIGSVICNAALIAALKTLLQADEPAGHALGGLVRRPVLVEVPVQALYPHVAPVGHEAGDGLVGPVPAQLHVGLEPAHALDHGAGVLALIVITLQQDLQLPVQGLVLVPARGQALLELPVFHLVQHLVNGGHPHFHPRVALPQQLDGIRFNHVGHLLCQIASEPAFLLERYHDQGKAPSPVVKGMGWLKTNPFTPDRKSELKFPPNSAILSLKRLRAAVAVLMPEGCRIEGERRRIA